MKSIIFVLVQFGTLGLIFLTGPLYPSNQWLMLVEAAGFVLGVWAVLAMGLGNFNITPDPVQRGQLVTRGPYGVIRHPMYMALLLVTAPLIIADFSILRGIYWLVLLIDLVLKLHYEEGLLTAKIDGYDEYMKQSYRLIPYIY